uniref:Cytoplasmic dynein light chain n=1 Tax=Rhizophora mucronata TaxID=61149 RepID=A0A2P2KL02_RHIMU
MPWISMMSLTANPLLPTSKRIWTRDMEVAGNVWLVQILGVSSLIPRVLLSTSHWRLSISSSSRELLLLYPLHESLNDGEWDHHCFSIKLERQENVKKAPIFRWSNLIFGERERQERTKKEVIHVHMGSF